MPHYIYIRQNTEQKQTKSVKVGYATDIVRRDYQYKTNEIIAGVFLAIFSIRNINEKKLRKMEKEIHNTLDKIPNCSGTEIFSCKKNTVKRIEKLIKKKYEYEIIDPSRYQELKRQYDLNQHREVSPYNSTCSSSCSTPSLESNNSLSRIPELNLEENIFQEIKLRYYQQNTYQKLITHYETNDKAIINWCCGLGKTIISCYYLLNNSPALTLIGVPSLTLLTQWFQEIQKYYSQNILLVGSIKGFQNATTDKNQIKEFIESNKEKKVIITTYHSSRLLIEHKFNMKINDEVHHLASKEKDRNINGFDKMLQIDSEKTLSLTATLKIIQKKDNNDENCEKIISNDDESIFGKVIDSLSVNEAINMGILCDYKVCVSKINFNKIDELVGTLGIDNFIKKNIDKVDTRIELENREEPNNIVTDTQSEEDDKKLDKICTLFTSAYMTLENINRGNSKHSIIFTNNIKNAKLVKKMIDIIIKKNPELNNKSIFNDIITSDTDNKTRKEKIDKFKESEISILSSVYIFGEGVDIPILDTVVFSENMGSVIRITQSALRPHRKNPSNPDKEA